MIRRSRTALFVLLVLVASAALFSRSHRADLLPGFIALYAGDTLWATALYVLLALAKPSAPPFELFLGTLLISIAVEFSQLYQAPWMNDLRRTFPLGYVLGYGFKWLDIICYSAGSVIGYTVDRIRTDRKRF